MLIFSTRSLAVIDDNWQVLAPGIEYLTVNKTPLSPWSHVHAFRVDLQHNQLKLIFAKNLAKQHATIEEFSKYADAPIAVNGGFFDHNFNALGLRITAQAQENPLKNISWWGVFYIKNNKPFLASAREYQYDKNIDFAIQSGPRLLVNGKIPLLKPGLAERTALGITKDNKIILLVTENTPLSTTTLGKMMKSNPLNCVDALNLDGGSSSQLRANIAFFQLHVPGFSPVSDAVIIKPR